MQNQFQELLIGFGFLLLMSRKESSEPNGLSWQTEPVAKITSYPQAQLQPHQPQPNKRWVKCQSCILIEPQAIPGFPSISCGSTSSTSSTRDPEQNLGSFKPKASLKIDHM